MVRGLQAAAAVFAAALGAVVVGVRAADPIGAERRIGGFVLGCQAYSFRRFSAFEAIEKTAQVGGRVIEFYPGQKLSPDEPDVTLGPDLSDAHIEKLKTKLQAHDVWAVNFGVVGLPNNETQSRKVFAFAKKLGIGTITSEPSANALDLIERLVKEYDIKVAIHNHPKSARDPSYKLWDPGYVRSLVEKRDRRIGACADTGHWVRSGVKPVDALRVLESRVVSSHLKDVRPFGPGGHDVPFGKGLSDIKGILDELRRQGFNGNVSIEYESEAANPVPAIAQCIGFVRGYAAARP